MFRKIPASVKVFFSLMLVAAFLFTGVGASLAQDTPGEEIEVVSPNLSLIHKTTADGKALTGYIINGPSKPPAGYKASSVTPSAEAGIIANFPSFSWVFGCSAVSGAMVATYYDRNSYPNMYTGPTNGGVMPLTDTSWPTWTDVSSTTYPNNPLIASHKDIDGRTTKGSIDDYWIQYGSSANDPYITGSWTQHSWGTAIGDYMKTSQSAYSNTDGSTTFYSWTSSPDPLTCQDMVDNSIHTYDGTYGRKLFYEARGYTVTDCYNQKTDNNSGGFTLAKFKTEIDAGRPVLLNLAGHSIVGYGYDGTTIYVRDTWDNDPSSTHTMTWGGSYSGMQLLSVSIVNLSGGSVPKIPVLKAPLGTIYDKTPTYKFTTVAGATKYQFRTYKGSATTPVYTIDVATSACTSTLCSKTPTTSLALAGYKWQARAYVGGAWKAWSAKKAFTVGTAPSGWESTFTSNANGWTKLNGTWSVAGGFYKTPGIYDNFTTSKHDGTYGVFTYTAKIKHTGCTTCAMGILFNGAPTPLTSTGRWNNGYAFYLYDGYYQIGMYQGGVWSTISDWVPYTVLAGINTLKVTYNKNTGYAQFYINGTKVGYGTLTTFKSGVVGVGMYQNATSMFYVDYAKLTLSAPSSAKAGEEGLFLDESAAVEMPEGSELIAP